MLRDYSDSAESLSSDTESGEGTGGSAQGRSAAAAILAAMDSSSSEKKHDSNSSKSAEGEKKKTRDEGATRSDTATNQISPEQINKNGLCNDTATTHMTTPAPSVLTIEHA